VGGGIDEKRRQSLRAPVRKFIGLAVIQVGGKGRGGRGVLGLYRGGRRVAVWGLEEPGRVGVVAACSQGKWREVRDGSDGWGPSIRERRERRGYRFGIFLGGP
jgi:hypothetical protein